MPCMYNGLPEISTYLPNLKEVIIIAYNVSLNTEMMAIQMMTKLSPYWQYFIITSTLQTMMGNYFSCLNKSYFKTYFDYLLVS